MTAGRTSWWPKDSAWWRRERIVAAGIEEVLAPAVMDWLTCEAKAQNPQQVSDGFLKTGYAAIAHGATFGHASPDEVRPVVSVLVRVGLLDDFEEAGHTFTCRISGWNEDVVLPLEAARRAGERAKKKPENGSTKPNTEDGRSRTNADTSGDVRERPLHDTTTHTSSLRSDDAPDEISDRLDDHLHDAAEHVHQRLFDLATAKGMAPPSLRRVSEIVADFPDHDHPRLVGDVVDYWQHGDGAKTKRKDYARVYRDFLGRKPAGATVTSIRPGQRAPLNTVDGFMAAQQARLDREDAAAAALPGPVVPAPDLGGAA